MSACGGKALDIGSTSTSTGGSAADGNGSGGGTEEPGDVCESFDDEQPQHVSIVLVNRTSVPIYLGPFAEGTCGPSPPPFSVQKNGENLVLFGGNCTASCAQLRDHGYLGCPAICLHPETIELAPDEERVIPWNGLVLTPRILPVECVQTEYGPQSDEPCHQHTAISAGKYTFAAHAGTELICSELALPEWCGSCDPSEIGGCVHLGSYVGGETFHAETEVDLGPSHGLRGSGAETSATVPIEIVFGD